MESKKCMFKNGQSEMFLDNGSKTGFCAIDEKSKTFPWTLYFSGLTANLLLFGAGMGMVWWSPVLPRIQSNDTDLNPLGAPVTLGQISTLVLLPSIGSPIGLLVTGILLDVLGRKKCLILAAIIGVCNQTAVAFARHIYLYYIYSIIGGMCGSMILVSVPVFNNEIAEDGNRGKLGCLMGLALPSGMLLGYIYDPVTSLKGSALIGVIPTVIFLAFSIMIPESPVFLALKGRKRDCMKSLEKLRTIKNPKYIETEYDKIEVFAESKDVKKRNFLDVFRNRSPRHAFFLCIGINMVQQFSGIFVILAFMGSIFQKAGGISGDDFGIISGIVQLIVFFIASFLVDRVGRRPLLLISSIICSISLFLLGLYFYLQYIESTVIDRINWLPIIGIVVYIIGYGLGLGPIPIALVGELFPNDLRAVGCATILIIDNAAIGTTMAIFPVVSAYWGVHCCMWYFSSCCFLGFLFMFFVLPETKGKSFAEIQAILKCNFFKINFK